MSSSDAEMVDSGLSDSEPECLQRIRVAADVAAACRRGPKNARQAHQAIGLPGCRAKLLGPARACLGSETTGWSYKR